MFKIYLSFVEPGDQYLGCSLAGLDPNKSEFVADNFKDFTGWKIMIHFIAIFYWIFLPKSELGGKLHSLNLLLDTSSSSYRKGDWTSPFVPCLA